MQRGSRKPGWVWVMQPAQPSPGCQPANRSGLPIALQIHKFHHPGVVAAASAQSEPAWYAMPIVRSLARVTTRYSSPENAPVWLTVWGVLVRWDIAKGYWPG